MPVRAKGQSAKAISSRRTVPGRRSLGLTVSDGSLYALFDYLHGKLSSTFSAREGKRRAVDALQAFWTPFALRSGGAANSQVQAAACQSIRELQRQMNLIEQEFGLAVSHPAPLRAAADELAEAGTLTESPPEGWESLAQLSDRDLLGDLLDL